MATKSVPQSFSLAAFLKRAESVYRKVENRGPDRERVEVEIRAALKLEPAEDPKHLAPARGSPLESVLHSLALARINFANNGGLLRGDELHGLCILAGLGRDLERILGAVAANLDRLEAREVRS